MKRLFQIGFDTLLLSIIPIIIWNIVGFVFSKDLAVVFAITYPTQFAFSVLNNLFGSGANIVAEKEKNKDIVYTNMLMGLIVGIALAGLLIFFAEEYITFFNADYNLLKEFFAYGIINIFYSFVLRLVLEKLYYERKNKQGNTISVLFNLLNLLLFVSLALITRNPIITICAVSIVLGVVLLVIFLANMKPFKFMLRIKESLLYSSNGTISCLALFVIYFVGLHNEFSFGEQYILVSNFISITTDAQWDMLGAISTITQIDVSKDEFNMHKSVKNAYGYVLFLMMSSIVMSVGLYSLYEPEIKILLIAFGVQIIHWLICPLYDIKLNYIQAKRDEINTNFEEHVMIEKLLRMVCSLVQNPYCTYIGQLVGALYLYIYTKYACKQLPIDNASKT